MQFSTDQKWKQQVLKRDDYTCQVPNCGAQTNLDAHHIQSRRQRPDLRRVLSNGVTLCRAHHNYFHDRKDEWQRFLAILDTRRKLSYFCYAGNEEPRQDKMES
jgi:predicted restriction endonuclease